MENFSLQNIKQEPEVDFLLIIPASINDSVEPKPEPRGRAVVAIKKIEFLSHKNSKTFDNFVKCGKCSKFVLNRPISLKHLKTCRGSKKFQCDLCDYNFILKGNVRKHMKTHCDKKCLQCGEKYSKGSRHVLKTKCWFCSTEFFCIKSRKKHIEDNHRNDFGFYECPRSDCKRKSTFKTLKRLQVHICIFHADAKRLTCRICSKKLSNTKNLSYHIQTVHTNASTRLSCDLCAYKTLNKILLKDHMKKHRVNGKPKRFTCDRCGYKVSNKYHMIKHLFRKPLECCYCDKKLSCKFLYDRHCLEVHGAQGKSWPCQTCKSIFPIAFKLTDHQKRQRHGKFATRKVEKLKCTRCGKIFKTRTSCLNHLRKVHKDKEVRKCQICLVIFATSERLKAHLENHEIVKTLQCPHCTFVSKEKSNLKAHVKRRHGEEIL
jgi:uncharacterized C2H2 Zn-finger protein